MDKLIESLFAQIEIFVVGALTVATWRSALALSVYAEQALEEYSSQIGKFWISTKLKDETALVMRALLIGGLLYYAGIFTTVMSYRFVAPIRYEVEKVVFDGDRCTENRFDSLRAEYYYLPLEFWREPGQGDVDYLKAEARLDVDKHERIRGILDDEHRIERVLRGSLWLSFCAACLCLAHLIRSWTWQRDEKTRQARAKYVTLMIASLVIYASAAWSYPAVEYEFNNFICLAAYAPTT